MIKSTDDFIYICNMKTGIFRYSPAQVKVFNLPGEIIDHPLPFWKAIVHPQDWERFYKSPNERSYISLIFLKSSISITIIPRLSIALSLVLSSKAFANS